MSKSKQDHRDEVIRARVTLKQKETMKAAAQAAGLDLSGWLRWLALREIKAQES